MSERVRYRKGEGVCPPAFGVVRSEFSRETRSDAREHTKMLLDILVCEEDSSTSLLGRSCDQRVISCMNQLGIVEAGEKDGRNR